ncbi:hypothetical protein [Fibrobacter sp.]
MALWHIAENLGTITNPYSSCLFEREMWRTAGVLDQQITFEEFVEQELNFALAKDVKTDGDAINYIWELSVYYFLCHIITYTGKKDLSAKKNTLKNTILKYLKILLNNDKSSIKLKANWVDWQYKQMPYDEFVKKYPNYFGVHIVNKAFLEENKEADEYQYAKATPCHKSEWLDEHLQALKRFITKGECEDEHFTYIMYLLLSEPDLGFPRPPKEQTGCINENEIETVILVSRFAAYIDNKTEMYQSINNFLVDYFFWFLRHEHSARKELDTWNGVSGEIEESCCKQNRCGDLYTIIQSDKDFCAWIRLLKFFGQISLDDAVIFLRCFGQIYSPYGDANDSTFFTENCKGFFSKDVEFLKENPGYVFCMYWMIHYLTLENFKAIFLEESQIVAQDDYCKKNGVIPESKPTFYGDSLAKLQMLMFFVLFDLTSKYELGYYEKKFALAPLMKTIEKGIWNEKNSLLDIFHKLEEKAKAKKCPLQDFIEDFDGSEESVNSAIFLVFNMANFFRNGEQCLIRELDHISALKEKKLDIPSHENYMKDNSKGRISGDQRSEYENKQRLLNAIDCGFQVQNFMQKVPLYKNLFLSRNLNVKIFIASDSDIKADDDSYYRNQYKMLWDNKYAYCERNMTIHFASFSKINALFEQKNLPDLHAALYDLQKKGPDVKWLVLNNGEFKQIPELPYYKKVITECFEMINSFLLEKLEKKPKKFFGENDGPTIERDKLKKLSIPFWEKYKENSKFAELKDILNIMFCNSSLYKWHAESVNKKGEVQKKSYADYNADFWTVYRYEIAVYLIQVAIKLTIASV